MKPEKTAIVLCAVWEEEMQYFHLNSLSFRKLVWLPMGLHDNPPELRRQLVQTISKLEADPELETVLFLYGWCGGGLEGLSSRRLHLVVPKAHDCISIMLGGRRAHEQFINESPGSFFYTPGWIREGRAPGPDRERTVRQKFATRYQDPEILDDLVAADRESFAHHDCAAYLDLTTSPQYENYTRKCAECLGWKFRLLQAKDLLIRNLLEGNWNPEDFVIIPPGQKLKQDHLLE